MLQLWRTRAEASPVCHPRRSAAYPVQVLERLKSCDPSLNHVALDGTVPGNSLHAVVDAQALAAGIKVCPQLTKLDLQG